MSAEDKMKRKSQVALEFFMTYGWAIFIVIIIIITLAYFQGMGMFKETKPQQINNPNPEDIVANTSVSVGSGENVTNVTFTIRATTFVNSSEYELQEICNKLVVNNKVYPFLEVMGNGLKKENDAKFVAYKLPAELRSNLDIFNVDGLILCGIPTELCYTEGNNINGGTYCMNWLLEVPVVYADFNEWYKKVSVE